MQTEEQIRNEMDSVASKLGNVTDAVAQIEDNYGSDVSAMDSGVAQRYREATISRSRLQQRYDELEDELTRFRDAYAAREAQKREILMRARMGYVEGGSLGQDIRRAGPQFMRRGEDAYDMDLDIVRAGHVDERDLISRGQYALEQAPSHLVSDESKHAVMARLDDGGEVARALSQHMLLTGSDAYRAEFAEFVKTQGAYRGPEIRRALALSPESAGGALVNFQLDPSIVLSNVGIIGSIRSMARVIQTAQNEWRGVTSDGVTVGWLDEGASASDNSPTFSRPSITAHKAFAYLEASYEFTADSGFESELSRLIADAKQRNDEAAFCTGSGAGQPYGVITRLVATTASRVAAATSGQFGVTDVFSMSDAASPRHGAASTWLANKQILNKTRQFSTATGNGGSFWVDLGPGTPSQLLGQPVAEQSTMDRAVGTTSSILALADLKNFYIVDRIGTTMVMDRMVRSSTTGMPTGEAAWVFYWRVGSDMLNPGVAGKILRMHTNTNNWV